ncbi:MAG TPA: histidine kinase [Pseudacidobacterium sp.]|nr:histidine kinase [Pseudacidobacterium sp.]
MQISKEQRLPSFWQFQAGGWIVYCSVQLISFLPSKELREELLYKLIFCIICFIASFPLHRVCRKLWREQESWRRVFWIVAGTCYSLGLVCGTILLWLDAKYLMPGWEKFELPYVFANAIAPAFVLALWSALYFSIKYYGAQSKERERLLHLESLVRQAELKALQYQIHPHFLFNTLNSISTLVYERDTATANRMIARLADFLRATLDDEGAYEVPLRDELDITSLYLEIEKTRLGERLTVIEDTDPALLDAAVPRLILQPLVENAVRHGIGKRRDGGRLFMAARRDQGNLVIEVRNDIMPRNGKKFTNGIGLTNIRTRLKQLYGNAHTFEIDFCDGDICKVTIGIPFHIYANPVEVAGPTVPQEELS